VLNKIEAFLHYKYLARFMRSLINHFRRDDEGAALVEYGILVGLIAVICVVAVTALGTEISTAFSTIASALSGI
jgi:pilus assembly protein Flp/PilA